MTAQRPSFQIKKKGYDRFAVDDAVEKYVAEIDQLEHKVNLYQQQLAETTGQLDALKDQYRDLLRSEEARRGTADEIARLSLREANEIINTANANADLIIKEALQSARGILEDLAMIYREAGLVKIDTKEKLEKLLRDLEEFNLPEMPDISWLKEAEEKMR